jgi:predicted nucleic acid-binding protein
MQISNFSVVFDTNVLFPQGLRDLLIRLAMKDLFRARWSYKILDELKKSLIEKDRSRAEKLGQPAKLDYEKFDRLIDLMNFAVQDCLVIGYEDIEKSLSLPDPKDNHVLAAAIRAGADAIITWNLKDFPTQMISKFDIEVQTPDEFVNNLFDLNMDEVIDAVRQQRAALKYPPYSQDQMLSSYTRNNLLGFVQSLHEFKHLI